MLVPQRAAGPEQGRQERQQIGAVTARAAGQPAFVPIRRVGNDILPQRERGEHQAAQDQRFEEEPGVFPGSRQGDESEIGSHGIADLVLDLAQRVAGVDRRGERQQRAPAPKQYGRPRRNLRKALLVPGPGTQDQTHAQTEQTQRHRAGKRQDEQKHREGQQA